MRNRGRGIRAFVLYALVFVLLPIWFIGFISDYLIANGLSPDDYFHGTQTYILIFGSLLSVFAGLTGYFEKGSPHRLGAGIVGALFLVLWGYFFIDSMSIFYAGSTFSYTVLVPGIAVILAITFSIRIFYRLVEYAAYRNEYRSPPFQPYEPTTTAHVPPQPQNMPPQSSSQKEGQVEDEEMYF